MPPADQNGKKSETADSLLGDFDFGDEDFNWDQLASVGGNTLNSEDELPPELRTAVVHSPDETLVSKPAFPTETKDKPTGKTVREPDVSGIFPPQAVSTEKYAASSNADPLALPPIDGEGDAAPLPPIAPAAGILGDFDLDFAVGPAKIESIESPDSIDATQAVGTSRPSSLVEPADGKMPVASEVAQTGFPIPADDDEEYDVQIDVALTSKSVASPDASVLLAEPSVSIPTESIASPDASVLLADPSASIVASAMPLSVPSSVVDPSISQILPDFGKNPTGSLVAGSTGPVDSTASERSVEFSLPPPPMLAPSELLLPETKPSKEDRTEKPATATPIETATEAQQEPHPHPQPQPLAESSAGPSEAAKPTSEPVRVTPFQPGLARVALRNEGTQIAPRRLPLPTVEHLPPPPPCVGMGAGLETATRKVAKAFFETEAQNSAKHPSDAAQLGLAAAAQAESLFDKSDAIDLYRRVLDLAPQNRTALRALRRLLETPGPFAQPDEAASLIERERAICGASEQVGLRFHHIELLRVSGQLGEARGQAQEFLTQIPRGGQKPGQAQALFALADVQFAQGHTSEVAQTFDGLIAMSPSSGIVRAVFQNERARLDELSGRDQATAQRFETSLAQQPTLTAALGLFRVAARLPRVRKDENEATPLSSAILSAQGVRMSAGLKAAFLRLSARFSPASQRKERFAQAAELGDAFSWDTLAFLAEQAKDNAAAGAAHLKSAGHERDHWKRADSLRQAGRSFLLAGQDESAQQALLASLSATTDGESDGVTYRLLERVCRKMGRPSDLLSMWQKQAQATDGEGAYALLYAADLAEQVTEGEAGRAQAKAELTKALQIAPDFEEAAHRLSVLLLSDGDGVQAAQVLLRATQRVRVEPADELSRRVLREEAVARLDRAGELAEAARVLAEEPPMPQSVVAMAPSLVEARNARLFSCAMRLRGVAEPALVASLAQQLHVAAATAKGDAAARLFFARGSLLSSTKTDPNPEVGPIEESYRQTLLAEPLHIRALLRLELMLAQIPKERVRRSSLSNVVTAALLARYVETAKGPSKRAWGLRLATAQEFDASEPLLALRTYRDLMQMSDGDPSLMGLDDWTYITAWRAGEALSVLERELAQDPDSDTRYALLILSGEQLEATGKARLAVQRYQQALELKPGHPVAKAKLVHACLAAGMLEELSRFTAAELKEATDIQTRIQAFERQVLLANLQIDDPAKRSEVIENAYRNVLTVDANNHLAMRALERHFLARGQFGELVHLYEQMGLTATDTAFAVHISSDRARLRQRLLWQQGGDAEATRNQMENDFRLALYRDHSCRPALRFLHEGATQRGDFTQLAELSQWIGELPVGSGPEEASQRRSAAVFLTRAAEAAAHLGQDADQVMALYQSALAKATDQVPTLRGLLHFALLHKRYAVALDCAEQLAEQLYDAEERYLHCMLAGVLSQNFVSDVARARKALAKGLKLLPDRDEAFERLRASYQTTSATSADDARGFADLLKERLNRSDLKPEQIAAFRVELGQLYAGLLKNRAMAKYELGEALRLRPDQPAALFTLGKLHADDSEWQHAIDPLRRYGQLETRPSQLLALHLLLGEIFSEQLQDPQQAIAEYTKAIQLQPTNQTALTKLADLFLAQNRGGETLPLLKRLVKYTEDKQRKIGYFHRIAALSELHGDSRGALDALREAVEVDSSDLPAIRELALFYERTSDAMSLRFHLDAAMGRFRPQLLGKPRDLAVHQTLLQILALRRSEQAHFEAGTITALGGVIPKDIQTRLEKTPQRKEPSKTALRDGSLDDALYPQVVSTTIRTVFKLLAEPLGKLYVSDGRKLQAMGVDRKEKLPRSGHPVRDLANKIASDFGLGEFDIYLTAAQGKNAAGQTVPHCTIEPLEPPALVVSNVLVEGASEAERRFLLSGLLKLLHSQLHLPLRLSAEDLTVLLGGLVRQQVKDYVPIGFAEKRIETEAQRQRRAIPSKIAPQILPLAMELHSTVPNSEGIFDALVKSSHAFGLLYGGNMAAAIASLRRTGPSAEKHVDALIGFAVSREADELLRILCGNA